MSDPAAGKRPAWRALGASCAIVLVLLLPALVAGVNLAAPARADEVARLAQALGGSDTGADSALARQFYVSALADTSPPADPAGWQALVGRARVSQVAGVLAIGLLTYLVVLLARGRLQALVATTALALLPPVLHDGHVLRPETPATLFALFATLLFQCFAQPTRDARRAATTLAQLSWLGLGVCAMFAAGVAIVTLPAHGAPLLVPGVVLTFAAALLLLRSVRIVRRRGQRALPLRALNRRLLPWTLTALLLPAMVLGLLSANGNADGAAQASAVTTGLWPPADPLAGLLLAVAAIGVGAAVLRVGGRLRRCARIGPDLVLFAACAVVLAGAAGRPAGADPLPLAPALAVMVSEGAWALCMLGTALLRARAT